MNALFAKLINSIKKNGKVCFRYKQKCHKMELIDLESKVFICHSKNNKEL